MFSLHIDTKNHQQHAASRYITELVCDRSFTKFKVKELGIDLIKINI